MGDENEFVSKVALQNGSRLIADANDLGVIGIFTTVQLVTDLSSDSSVDCAAQTTIGCHGNEELLWLSGGLGDLSLLVEVLGAKAIRTSLFQVTFSTSVSAGDFKNKKEEHKNEYVVLIYNYELHVINKITIANKKGLDTDGQFLLGS